MPTVSSTESAPTPDLGDMKSEDFRRFGHELVDWIADYFDRIESLPVLSQIQPGDLKAKLPASPPQQGERMENIVADLDRLIVPALTHWSHPSFHAYFATSTSGPGILGELLAAAFDNKAMLWRTSPASTELEAVTLDWLRQMMGLDAGMHGLIYDTASVSSLHAIAAAREGVEKRIREEGMSGRADLPLLRVYVSEQAHSSIEKAVITLGLGQRGVRKIPTDSEFRMDANALSEAIKEDKRNGYLPFCIVATVGTKGRIYLLWVA
jgi:aromatic-L-amino-acid decarboxylase